MDLEEEPGGVSVFGFGFEKFAPDVGHAPGQLDLSGIRVKNWQMIFNPMIGSNSGKPRDGFGWPTALKMVQAGHLGAGQQARGNILAIWPEGELEAAKISSAIHHLASESKLGSTVLAMA